MENYNKPLECCPNCGSGNLEETETFFDTETIMVQYIQCNDCDEKWTETWTFLHTDRGE
jgi:formate dehydrogenase maturation protein FdhE